MFLDGLVSFTTELRLEEVIIDGKVSGALGNGPD